MYNLYCHNTIALSVTRDLVSEAIATLGSLLTAALAKLGVTLAQIAQTIRETHKQTLSANRLQVKRRLTCQVFLAQTVFSSELARGSLPDQE